VGIGAASTLAQILLPHSALSRSLKLERGCHPLVSGPCLRVDLELLSVKYFSEVDVVGSRWWVDR
jgi:hypothetical protein